MFNHVLFILNRFTTKRAYLANFTDNDSDKIIAEKLWREIDNGDWIPFIIMVVVTLLVCGYYYFPFNNSSGRHYQIKYLIIFGFIALILVLISTFVSLLLVTEHGSFDYALLLKATGINCAYAIILYVVIACGIIKTGKSNAYPFI